MSHFIALLMRSITTIGVDFLRKMNTATSLASIANENDSNQLAHSNCGFRPADCLCL